MYHNFGLFKAVCFIALWFCNCQLVTTDRAQELLDFDIRLLSGGNEDVAQLLLSSLEYLTPSEAASIRKQSYQVNNLLNVDGQEFFDQNPDQEPKYPFITATPRPPMTAEERKKFKFVFPKGHFMNDLLYPSILK